MVKNCQKTRKKRQKHLILAIFAKKGPNCENSPYLDKKINFWPRILMKSPKKAKNHSKSDKKYEKLEYEENNGFGQKRSKKGSKRR